MIICAGQNIAIIGESAEPSTVEAMVYSQGTQRENPGGYWCMLDRVSFDELQKMRCNNLVEGFVTGMPQYFAVQPNAPFHILLYPTNDEARELRVRYCPAMKEV